MEVSSFLNNLIKKVNEVPETLEDKKNLRKYPLEKFIFDKLMVRRYRTRNVSSDLSDKIKSKIGETLKAEKPLHFTIPFGGYKLWKFPTYPGPDWSELFNLILLRSYLARISRYWKPGIILEYWSDEIMVARINNYPQGDLDTYNDAFEELIRWFGDFLPNNLEIRFNKIRNVISYERYHEKTDEYIKKNKSLWNKVSQDQRELRLKKAERNYQGDFSSLNSNDKQNILLESALGHDAFIFGDWDENIPWAFASNMIPLGFQYTGSWGIPIKSSTSSTTQFWVGMGFLIKNNNDLTPSIATFSQYQDIKNRLRLEKVQGIPDNFTHLQQIAIFET